MSDFTEADEERGVEALHGDDPSTKQSRILSLGIVRTVLRACLPSIKDRWVDEAIARAGNHIFMEAAGGYIECSCGWPSREQYDNGEAEIAHILREEAQPNGD